MSGETSRPPSSGATVCGRHGLRFDPATQTGCVICRREGAGATPTPRAASPAGAGRAWAIAALLWLAAGGVLFLAHREVLASFSELRLIAGLLSGDEAAAGDAGD